MESTIRIDERSWLIIRRNSIPNSEGKEEVNEPGNSRFITCLLTTDKLLGFIYSLEKLSKAFCSVSHNWIEKYLDVCRICRNIWQHINNEVLVNEDDG